VPFQTRTKEQIKKMISALSGAPEASFTIVRIDVDGGFSAELIDPEVSAQQIANVNAICERMRTAYRLKV
jgi:hypothetical protein